MATRQNKLSLEESGGLFVDVIRPFGSAGSTTSVLLRAGAIQHKTGVVDISEQQVSLAVSSLSTGSWYKALVTVDSSGSPQAYLSGATGTTAQAIATSLSLPIDEYAVSYVVAQAESASGFVSMSAPANIIDIRNTNSSVRAVENLSTAATANKVIVATTGGNLAGTGALNIDSVVASSSLSSPTVNATTVNATAVVANTLSVGSVIGSLNVTGTTVTVNSGEAGAGVAAGTAGFVIDRGSATNASLLFKERAYVSYTGPAWTSAASTSPGIVSNNDVVIEDSKVVFRGTGQTGNDYEVADLGNGFKLYSEGASGAYPGTSFQNGTGPRLWLDAIKDTDVILGPRAGATAPTGANAEYLRNLRVKADSFDPLGMGNFSIERFADSVAICFNCYFDDTAGFDRTIVVNTAYRIVDPAKSVGILFLQRGNDNTFQVVSISSTEATAIGASLFNPNDYISFFIDATSPDTTGQPALILKNRSSSSVSLGASTAGLLVNGATAWTNGNALITAKSGSYSTLGAGSVASVAISQPPAGYVPFSVHTTSAGVLATIVDVTGTWSVTVVNHGGSPQTGTVTARFFKLP